jgi:Flp pilus assembly protein TadD
VTPPEDERDDKIARLLASLDTGAALPDRAFLQNLREQSTAAFAASSSQTISPSSKKEKEKGRAMIYRVIIGLAATAAAIALLVAFFYHPGPDEKLAFADVLKEVQSAKTMHVKVTREGATDEIWAEHNGRFRRDDGSGTTVTDGESVWRVEKVGGKALRQSELPERDVVKVLLAKDAQGSTFDPGEAKPAGTVTKAGRECLVYRLNVQAGKATIFVDALVDAQTKKLAWLQAKHGPAEAKEPIAELEVLDTNADLPEEKFAILNSLSEDGRVGKVTDTQGVVTVKPLNTERWTPVEPRFVLQPGDWLRTDIRGANAAAVKLLSRTGIIVGPGSLLELPKPTQVKLLEGEMEISVPKGSSIELLGPDEEKVVVKGTQLYRVDNDRRLRLIAKEPLWLRGFKGTTANESLGSLIAKVDGRNVPLTVGYHKVSVEIRDQIARTTIEESFENNTDTLLEGVFHFPLPQDASISGFGMWIGNELVMADVVEKQRAREIYETILREKRDPGLLEWAGGNTFKARVYPIFAHSEKRIKIIYTQVLPLRGNSYRYSYALQSEMLQQHPLRELSLSVLVNSAVPLKKVSSPTHSTRDQIAKNSARLDFSAQEYTPTKDFEVVVEQEQRANDVVLIPYQRGNDGYFMLQVTPPSSGEPQRSVLSAPGALSLLILADTSASMSRGDRQKQDAFIASLLASLTPRDTFNLSACDVNTNWVFNRPVPAEAKNVFAARQMLEKRVSLGWTDLDKAFASAIDQCGAKTHVIYVGDGIPTARDADPVAFAKRLKQTDAARAGTFHAISVGSSFESNVLKAIGSLGGGSVRHITSEQGPTAVALELLREIVQPALRDVKVEFTGLQTARVYPAELPNVPAGQQQITLGRYLPEGKNQTGEVTVSGTLNGKPIKMSAGVEIKGDGFEESFIPRLWARMHLDYLLEQGASEAVKEEIIALSEEYNIITPYTSLLVLETDADRERFGVKRRFQMRDGEKFFAKGRDNANYQLVQQQMKRAGLWRLNLRREELKRLATLRRDIRLLQEFRPPQVIAKRGFVDVDGDDRLASLASLNLSESAPVGGGGPYAQNEFTYFGMSEGKSRELAGVAGGGLPERMLRERLGNTPEEAMDLDALGGDWDAKDAANKQELDDMLDLGEVQKAKKDSKVKESGEPDGEEMDFLAGGTNAGAGRVDKGKLSLLQDGLFGPDSGPEHYRRNGGDLYAYTETSRMRRGGPGNGYFLHKKDREPGFYNDSLQWQRQWWTTLLPPLPAKPAKDKKPVKSNWPEDARKLAQSLLRTEKLRQLKGGLELTRVSKTFDARWQELTSRARSVDLYTPASWLTVAQADGSPTTINWCDSKQRGVFNKAFQIGRLRDAVPQDLEPQLSLDDYSLQSLEEAYATGYAVSLEDGKDTPRLVLKSQTPGNEIHIQIDRSRHVILSIETVYKDKVQAASRFSDFVEMAGCWWARKIEMFNEKGEKHSSMTLAVKEISAEEFAQRQADELKGRESVLFIKQFPKVSDAKRAAAENKATIEDQVTLLRYFAATQQWTKVREHLEAAEQLSKQPGMRFLRDAVLHLSRKYDDLRKRFMAEAERLARIQLNLGEISPNDDYALANYVYRFSANFLQAGEMLELLDKLKGVYQQQPAHRHAMKEFAQMRISYLHGAGKGDEGLALTKQLAIDYPRDEGLQRQYAQALFSRGDVDAGYAWIAQALSKNDKWLEWEEENLRNLVIQYLQQQGRFSDLLSYVQEWMKKGPGSTTPYAIYLSTLVRLDQEEKANAEISRWLEEGLVEGDMSPGLSGRLTAAVNQALGQGYNLYTNRMDERWLIPLARVVRFHIRSEKNGGHADQIMQNGHFTSTDECRKVRTEIAGMVVKETATLPLGRLALMLEWIYPNDPEIDAATWRAVTDGLRRRWEAEKEVANKVQAANILVKHLRQRGMTDELLAFLRLQLEQGSAEQKPDSASQLFNTLLEQPWKAEHETESFRLLDQLSNSDETAERTRVKAEALMRWVDRMITARQEDSDKKIDRPDKLTRTELADKKAANLKAAREAVADALAAALLAKTMPPTSPELAKWTKIEWLYLETVLELNTAQLAADCWQIIGNDPPKPPDVDAEIKAEDVLESLRKDRAFAILSYLTTRKKADPALVERLLQFLDKGIAHEGEGTTWKMAKQRLLIALDKPKELEQDLRRWLESGKDANQWRLSLGFLLAELGRLKEAVELFEKVEAADELGPLAYRTLAGWYMALDQRDKHEKALLDQYKMTDEYTLSRMINGYLYPWQRHDGHLPSELDKEVLRVFKVLFEKSANPANYLYQLQQFYQACRDFRLLGMLADAVVGQTPGKVYPFLQGMNTVFNEIRDEAVVDEMMEHLKKVREKAKTPVDQRALDLFEVLVQRRAAELKNQPGPHGERALAALKRAFDRQWAEGEQRLMADLLAHLGRIAFDPLANEQVRELESLYAQQKKSTFERLHVAHRLANIYFSYGRSNNALEVLEAELAAYQAANNGILPVDANDALGIYISYLESVKHHGKGEAYLQGQLKHAIHEQQRLWLAQRLDQLYYNALANDGEVSFGAGARLYQAFEKKLRSELGENDPNHRYNLFTQLCNLYRLARDKHIAAYAGDLRQLAFKELAGHLKGESNNYDSIISSVAQTVHDLLSPRDAIAFILDRIETEPAWLRLNNQDGWARHASNLAYWRTETKGLGDLEPRLLKVVLAELRLDLETRRERNRSMYFRNYSYYWAEKEAAFLKVAEDVLAKRSDSGEAVKYIAYYFNYGLGKPGRATEALYAAHEKKLLDETGQSQLVQYLREQNRYQETIALLVPLMEKRPENLQYRAWQMNAYFHTKQREKLLALLKETDAYFHEKERWDERAMYALANSCLEDELFVQSEAYFRELIPIHQRNAPRRGIGDGTLYQYYSQLGEACSRQGKTAEAVEAVSGAIIAWSQNMQQRNEVLERLKQVLISARDLEQYVAQLDKQEADTKQASPIIHKALGHAFQARNQVDKAIVQYRHAVELQPEDAETQQQMIACYDKIGDRNGAVHQLLEAVQITRRNPALYEDLGNRYGSLNQAAEAERAYTSIVEMQANEAESHAKLAEIWQKQNRWEEAIPQWEHAAKLRALEPTGLIGLAKAQLHLQQWQNASQTVKKLESTTWPARFDNLRGEISQLRMQVEQGRNK